MERLVICLAALLICAGTVLADDAKKVVIYAALDEKTTKDLAAAFQAATGYTAEIALQIEQAGTVAACIKTEAPAARADLVIGGKLQLPYRPCHGRIPGQVHLSLREVRRHRYPVHGSGRLLDGLVPGRPLHPVQREEIQRGDQAQGHPAASEAQGEHNIHINAIPPGLIQTQMAEDLGFLKGDHPDIPLQRLGTPMDIANTALYLASSLSDYITGMIVDDNGGLYMR